MRQNLESRVLIMKENVLIVIVVFLFSETNRMGVRPLGRKTDSCRFCKSPSKTTLPPATPDFPVLCRFSQKFFFVPIAVLLRSYSYIYIYTSEIHFSCFGSLTKLFFWGFLVLLMLRMTAFATYFSSLSVVMPANCSAVQCKS